MKHLLVDLFNAPAPPSWGIVVALALSSTSSFSSSTMLWVKATFSFYYFGTVLALNSTTIIEHAKCHFFGGWIVVISHCIVICYVIFDLLIVYIKCPTEEFLLERLPS